MPCPFSHLTKERVSKSFPSFWSSLLMNPTSVLDSQVLQAGGQGRRQEYTPAPAPCLRAFCQGDLTLYYPPLAKDRLFQISHTNAASPGSHKGYHLGCDNVWGLRHTTRPSS